jgi:hypothetical protein
VLPFQREFQGLPKIQKLEKSKENLLKVKIPSNSSKEAINEFTLADIKPSSVKMQNSGKNVVVTASTYYIDKIIKFYEDGEIKNYQNTFENRGQ